MFNISAFCLAVFGDKEHKHWTRLVKNPERLPLEVAIKMAKEVDVPFLDLIVDANKMVRRAEGRAGAIEPAKPTGTHGE